MIKKLVLLFLVLMLSVGCAHATDYYFSPDGSGSEYTLENPGDPSVGDSLLSAGDTGIFLPGDYEDIYIGIIASGTSENPLTLEKYNESVVIDGNNYAANASSVYAIDINGNDYVTIDGLNVTGYPYAVDGTNCDNLNVKNCNFYYLGHSAIDFIGSTNSIAHNCTFSNLLFNHVQIKGTAEKSNNIHILNNSFEYAYGHNFVDFANNFTNCTVENNTFRNSTYSGVYVHQTTYDGYLNSGYITVKNNTMSNVSYGVYFDDPCNNSVISGNIVSALNNPVSSGQHIKITDPTNNVTISENSFWGDTYGYIIQINVLNSLVTDNNVTASETDFEYRFLSGGSGNTLRNPLVSGKTSLKSRNDVDTLALIFPNGRVFGLDSGIPVYTSVGSTYMQGVATRTLTLYNYSAMPTTENATVTPRAPVGTEILNFTAESTNGNLVTFDAWNLIPSAQYTIKEDGSVKSTQLANETGHISWNNDVWSEHIYTVILSPPVAAFSASPLSGAATTYVTFTDESTLGPTSWLWDFGDGTTSTLQNPVHTYSTAGTFTVNLTVSNAAGSDSEVKTDYITITDAVYAPVASFSANVTSGALPLDVLFTDSSTNTPTSWLWNFGDGTTSTDQNPEHTYSVDGSYTVTLTASNAAGSNTYIKSSYISAGTTTSFSLSYVMWWLRVHTPWWGLAYPLVGEA